MDVRAHADPRYAGGDEAEFAVRFAQNWNGLVDVLLEECWALSKGPVERTPWYLLLRGPTKQLSILLTPSASGLD
jgi:hypothetical protein